MQYLTTDLTIIPPVTLDRYGAQQLGGPMACPVVRPSSDYRTVQEAMTICHALRMAHFPQSHASQRAPRVRVTKSASFSISSKRIPAVLQSLSTTGGLARIASSLPPGTLAELVVDTNVGRVSGLVEFLGTPKGDSPSQAFRFIAFSDEDYERLSSTIELFRVSS